MSGRYPLLPLISIVARQFIFFSVFAPPSPLTHTHPHPRQLLLFQEINAAWVKAGHDNGLYVIVHVGTTVLSDAVELARHAK
jgi:hypothetical protein